MKKAIRTMALAAMCCLSASAQEKLFNSASVQSPVVNPNGTVTFNIYAPKSDPDFAQQSAKLFGSKPKLYWMGMGKTDFLYQGTVDLRNYWDSKGYKYEYVETDGGHIWRNWRIYLTMFAQKIFK